MSRIACLSLVFLFACDDGPGFELGREPAPEHDSPTDPAVEPDELPVEVPEDEPEVDDPEALPFLVSRFSPHQGITGARVSILTAFDPSGCSAAGECAITIGGADAPVADDSHVLEVLVPSWARTGPLCVTWLGRTECSGEFVVMPTPLIYQVSHARIAAGSPEVEITVSGDGFADDSELWLDWAPLETTLESAYTLSAFLPASSLAVAGTHELFVYSPSSGRCGARSEPVVLTVE